MDLLKTKVIPPSLIEQHLKSGAPHRRTDFRFRSLESEKIASTIIHEQVADRIPVLISPTLLRQRGLGQIDVCCYSRQEEIFILWEIKAHERGVSPHQRQRLVRSGEFLAQLFERSFQLKVWSFRGRDSLE